MTVLVTGGAGYIGSHMVIALLDVGERVIVLDDLSNGFQWAVPKQAILQIGDVGDQELVTLLIKRHNIDTVIHFAGSIVVADSLVDPLGYYKNNTVKSRSLIEAAVCSDVRHFIFSSTAAVYGTPENIPVHETAPMKPISPYGSSKMMTELMLADAAQVHNFNYVVLRYFNVAGADPEGRSGQSSPLATHLIKVASQTALGQRPYMEIFGDDYDTSDGTCVRDYIHVSDLAQAHMAALDYLRSGGASDRLNCGYGKGYSVREVIDAVERAAGRSFEVRVAGRRPGDPDSLIAGADKIRQRLGWIPGLDDLDTIVAQALAWENHLSG